MWSIADWSHAKLRPAKFRFNVGWVDVVLAYLRMSSVCHGHSHTNMAVAFSNKRHALLQDNNEGLPRAASAGYWTRHIHHSQAITNAAACRLREQRLQGCKRSWMSSWHWQCKPVKHIQSWSLCGASWLCMHTGSASKGWRHTGMPTCAYTGSGCADALRSVEFSGRN